MAIAAPFTFESEFARPGPPNRQYAFVRLSFRAAASFSFTSNASWPEEIPSLEVAGFERAIEMGVRDALDRLAAQRFEVRIEGVGVETNVSTQMAFKIAASQCVQLFYAAIMRA